MTRYPKSGKGRKWTVRELQAVPAEWKGDTLSDGEGLVGEVRAAADGSVSVRFKYAFKWLGKVAWHQCGTWPTVTLEAIREQRDRARTKLKAGVNPNDAKKAERIEEQAHVAAVIAEEEQRRALDLTLKEMFMAWVENGVRRGDGNAELIRRFQKDVLPALGERLVRELAPDDIRGVLRAVVMRGANRLAVLMHQDLRQMFRWGQEEQPWRRLLIEGDPTKPVKVETIVADDYDLSNTRERVLSPAELAELHGIFDRTAREYEASPNRRSAQRPLPVRSQCAVWICLSTLSRIGETVTAEWAHVDLEAGEWFIPAENTKGVRGKKRAHHVYLSRFALSQFQRLHGLTGHTRWCFPARGEVDTHIGEKSITKQIGDRQVIFASRQNLKGRRNDSSLVVAGGASGEWTPHDLRRTGATMMQELGVHPDIIDQCQNHVLGGSKVRRNYLHYKYAAEKRAAWALLGDRLDEILGPVATATPDTEADPIEAAVSG